MKKSVTNQAETEKEESEEYSLVSALPERGERQGEFWLYDKNGEVLQRIPQDIFTEQAYRVIYRNDRRNLVFFPDENSEGGGYKPRLAALRRSPFHRGIRENIYHGNLQSTPMEQYQ